MAAADPLLKTKTIDDITFSLMPVGGWDAIQLFHSLTGLLGPMTPMIATMLAADKSKPIAEQIDLEKLLDVLPKFLERASPETIRALTEQMLNTCQYRLPSKSGKQTEFQQLLPLFDKVMRGKLLTTFKLLAWAVTVNFADFFVGAKLALAAKKNAAGAEATSTEESSSPSDPTPPSEG